jgi:poly-gamma-glutamate capsule biosynthesis protein CapA/YwtB (metallophosphatase superfamily)
MRFKLEWGNLLRAALIALFIIGISAGLGETAQDETPATVIRVAAMGDIMMGTENLLPADGGKGLFLDVKPHLKGADVVFGNIEGSLTDKGSPTKTGKAGRTYCFRTPPSYVTYLVDAGFNMVSIANNHINDYGPLGKQQTIETLKTNKIGFSGPTGTTASMTAKGLKIALVAFHTSAHSNHLNDYTGSQRLVAGLAKTHDLVIVSFHGGAEGAKALHVRDGSETFYGEDRGDVKRFSRGVIDAGADLVIGHGPHVPRAMEIYKGHLIAYSLGNFCTGKGISVKGNNGLAPLLLADLTKDGKIAGGQIVSFIQAFGQHPKQDKKNRAAKLIYKLGVEDLPKTNAVDANGRIVVPPGN